MARPCLRLGAVVALAAALTAEGGGAARAAPENPAAAREHYDRGTKFYDIGRYDDAIREFEAAYQAKADPAFIFNLAQAHRLAGHNQEALRLYRTYLRYVPDPPNREDIETKIAALEKASADRPASVTTPPPASTTTPPPQDERADRTARATGGSATAPPPVSSPSGTDSPPAYPIGAPPAADPPPLTSGPSTTGVGAAPGGADFGTTTEAPSRSRRQTTAIAIASVGGGLILTGAVFGLIAENAENRVEEAGRNMEPFKPGVDRLGRFSETMQWVGLGVGLAAVATGLVLYVTDRKTSPDAPAFSRSVALRPVALRPLVSASSRGAALEVTF